MNDPVHETRSTGKWLWPVVVILIVIGALFWFAKPLGEPEKVGTAEPVAQSTEWTEVPAGPAVPVTLPTTPLKNVPIENRDESREAVKKAE
jgi:hypothetical protein